MFSFSVLYDSVITIKNGSTEEKVFDVWRSLAKRLVPYVPHLNTHVAFRPLQYSGSYPHEDKLYPFDFKRFMEADNRAASLRSFLDADVIEFHFPVE